MPVASIRSKVAFWQLTAKKKSLEEIEKKLTIAEEGRRDGR